MNGFASDFAGRSVRPQSQHWCTPPKYVRAVKEMFNGRIALDPCANAQSIVGADTELSLPTDGLAADWNYATVYVNPPYGADRERGTTIKDWLRQCARAHRSHNAEVIALVPVATNTAHWKQYVFGEAAAICFLYDTRLKFLVNGSTANKGAPMACAMVYWGGDVARFRDVFSPFGAVADVSDLRRPGRDIPDQLSL